MKIMLCLGLTFFLVSSSCNKSKEQTSSDSDTESIAKEHSNTGVTIQTIVGTDGKGNKAICSYETNRKQRSNPELFISPKVPVPGLIKADDQQNAQVLRDIGAGGTAVGGVGIIACGVFFVPCAASVMSVALTVTAVSAVGMIAGLEKEKDQQQFSGNVSSAVGFEVTKVMGYDDYYKFVNRLVSLPPAKGLECKNVKVANLKNPGN